MLTVVMKVILDIFKQKGIAKKIEFVCKPEMEFQRMRIGVQFYVATQGQLVQTTC